jgi:2',3'-cyclic-nucleotide 2'-phosphodiesterase
MRILFIGDIVGQPGRKMVAHHLQRLVATNRVDVTIANAENAAAGFGITPNVAQELFGLGIDLLTSGNHIWDKKEAAGYLAVEGRILRPANYPDEVPGSGKSILRVGERLLGVLNLQGRAFMLPIDCPFRAADRELAELSRVTDAILVDFHAEATAEKQAFAWYVDGRVSAVLGTHTHVQTADERLLPGRTAYISDVGMTGPRDSVIGIRPEDAIPKFLTQMPRKFTVAEGPVLLSAVLVDIGDGGRASAIQRIQIVDD